MMDDTPSVTPRRRIAPLNSTGAALQVELAPDPRLGKHDLIIYSTLLFGRVGRKVLEKKPSYFPTYANVLLANLVVEPFVL